MKVNPVDGRCRSCGGTLEVTDADEASMTVECDACGDCYFLEPDALGDGCMKYFVGFHAHRAFQGGDEER